MSDNRNDNRNYNNWTKLVSSCSRSAKYIFIFEDSRLVNIYRNLLSFYFRDEKIEVLNSNQVEYGKPTGKLSLYSEFEESEEELEINADKILIILDPDFDRITSNLMYNKYNKHKNFYYWKKYSFENYFVMGNFLTSKIKNISNIAAAKSFEQKYYLWTKKVISFYKKNLPDIIWLLNKNNPTFIGGENLDKIFDLTIESSLKFVNDDYIRNKLDKKYVEGTLSELSYKKDRAEIVDKLKSYYSNDDYLFTIPGKVLMNHFLMDVVPAYNQIFKCNETKCLGKQCHSNKCCHKISDKHSHESYIKEYFRDEIHMSAFFSDFELIRDKLGILNNNN